MIHRPGHKEVRGQMLKHLKLLRPILLKEDEKVSYEVNELNQSQLHQNMSFYLQINNQN
jgi:hypothetical protein